MRVGVRSRALVVAWWWRGGRVAVVWRSCGGRVAVAWLHVAARGHAWPRRLSTVLPPEVRGRRRMAGVALLDLRCVLWLPPHGAGRAASADDALAEQLGGVVGYKQGGIGAVPGEDAVCVSHNQPDPKTRPSAAAMQAVGVSAAS